MALTALGKYRLVALLGQGGMSDVYLAATTTTAPVDFTKLVALKRLRGDYYDDIALVTMFLDEARIAARLNHPNVVLTHEVSEADGDFFLAMEYLAGETLARLLERSASKVSRGAHLTILCEALAGIDYAHNLRDYDGTSLRLVHRDMSPQNIFLTFDGRVKVMDFGIAKAAGRIAETRHGVIKGKVSYMAPEQAIVGTPVDHRADLFAIGIMIYEACTKGRMWADVSSDRVLARLAEGDIPVSVQDVDPSLPDEIEAICARALAFEPARRYQSAAEMQTELEAYIDGYEKRPSPRQLGELLSQEFADQKSTIQALIEARLTSAPSPSRPSLATTLRSHQVRQLSPVEATAENEQPTKVEHARGVTHPHGVRDARRVALLVVVLAGLLAAALRWALSQWRIT